MPTWKRSKSVFRVPERTEFRRPSESYSTSNARTIGGNTVVVFTIEQFYARNLAELQATVVLERIDETTCEGVILAGGGCVGVAKVTLGAEKSMADDVLETIEAYCENNDLALEKRRVD